MKQLRMSKKSKESPSLTNKQALVMNLLGKTKGPLSAYAILDQLHDSGFRGPVQVYRALEKLMELGLVHRLESLNAFVACQQRTCDHQSKKTIIFTICEICGSVQELVNNGLEHLVRSFEKDIDFLTNRSVIELKGIRSTCKDCLLSFADSEE